MPLTPRSSDEHVSVRGADPYVDALPPEKVLLQHARKRAARGSQAHAVCCLCACVDRCSAARLHQTRNPKSVHEDSRHLGASRTWHERIACCRLRRRVKWWSALRPTRADVTDGSCSAARIGLGGSVARSGPTGWAAQSVGRGSQVVTRRCRKTTFVKPRRRLPPPRVLAAHLLGRPRARRSHPAREQLAGRVPKRGLRPQPGRHKPSGARPHQPASQHMCHRRSVTVPNGSPSTARNWRWRYGAGMAQSRNGSSYTSLLARLSQLRTTAPDCNLRRRNDGCRKRVGDLPKWQEGWRLRQTGTQACRNHRVRIPAPWAPHRSRSRKVQLQRQWIWFSRKLMAVRLLQRSRRLLLAHPAPRLQNDNPW